MVPPTRVLTWNLKHGRAVPSARRDLFDAFAGALAGWAWDVALLQEVPPWWPSRLGARLAVAHACVLTSRNLGLPLRRFAAVRWPDLIKSNGGGCNAILVRGAAIDEHRVARVSWRPERRWIHAVRLGRIWVANTHLQGTEAQALSAARLARGWAGGAPVVLGGDFNVRGFRPPGFDVAAENGVDYVFVAGMAVKEACVVLDRGSLSDHAPVVAGVSPQTLLS